MFDDFAADDYTKKLQYRHPQCTGENTGKVEDRQGKDGENEQSGEVKRVVILWRKVLNRPSLLTKLRPALPAK